MNSHEDAPTRKFNEATLARVKKEMDAPRITESARNEEASQPGHAGFGKAAIIQRGKESRAARARVNAAEKEKITARLTAATRDRLSATKFAFPRQRKEPLENASHVRNAAARFALVRDVTEAERRAAWKHIQSAAKRYGVELQKAS